MSRQRGKHAVPATARARGHALGWSDVLRCLSVSEDARKLAIARYRAAGFRPDEFTHSAAARASMADALAFTEDWLKLHRPRAPWKGIRWVRRGIEINGVPGGTDFVGGHYGQIALPLAI